MPTRHWIATGSVLAVVLVGSLWFQRSAPAAAPLQLSSDTTQTGSMTVHVSGAVVAPGLVEIGPGARIAEAVAAAGGTTREADLASLNLAAPLQDGQQVVVPTAGDSSDSAIRSDGKVSLNNASVAELEELPGVGPVLAARIAAFRTENGPFAEVEDLLDVSGIGEAKLATIRESVALP